MNTKKYKTRTEFIERKNAKKNGVWEIGLDIGYSAVKAFSPNSISCFPAFAIKSDELQFIGKTPKEVIMYKDLTTNETWVVGEYAQNDIKASDTSVSEALLYSRDRYTSKAFEIYARTGIGVSMMNNMYGSPEDDRIVIQTGLPERYLNDKYDLIDVLSGNHNFALKVGNDDWTFFNITISPEDVDVISQPKAAMFCVCIDNNGKLVPQYTSILNGKSEESNTIVFDPGFGTLDIFILEKAQVIEGQTYPDLGMKRVFKETSALISENFGVDIPVYAMQRYLEDGLIKVIDKKAFLLGNKDAYKEYSFDKLLAQASNMVCDEAIARMVDAIGFESLSSYRNIIVTGGTGAAWMHNIEEKFKIIPSIKVINANVNDNLPSIYNNVRGYYLYRYTKLLRED